MSSNLSRPISEGELDYLRRAQGELIRTNGVMAMYAVALMAASALYFGYRIGGLGGNGWGLLLLGIGAALLAYAFRIALFKNPAATMTFEPVLVNGLFTPASSNPATFHRSNTSSAIIRWRIRVTGTHRSAAIVGL